VECCLNERAYNPYYCLLMARLCGSNHNHKFTLQYTLWDQFKQLDEMPVRRLLNLARLLAAAVAGFCLSLAVLKVPTPPPQIQLAPPSSHCWSKHRPREPAPSTGTCSRASRLRRVERRSGWVAAGLRGRAAAR